MGERIKLKASDRAEVVGCVSRPAGEPKASLVIAQEIFGVTPHIRSVADDYAARGFLVVTPAYFDRYQPGFEVPYDQIGMQKGQLAMKSVGWEGPMRDTAAAVEWLRSQCNAKIGVLGFCWGGSLAWLAASQVDGLSAAVGYYGRLAAMDHVNDKPRIPVMMHFGAKDQSIPQDKVQALREAHPDVPVYVYEDAGHAFNRSGDPHYVESAAKLAQERTLKFLAEHLEFAE